VTERDDTQETPEISRSEGADAVAEGAAEAVDPAPAATAAPPAVTPDQGGPADAVAGAVDERPEVFVGGAFLGGLVLAIVLRQIASD
jgi:hypothetical protein